MVGGYFIAKTEKKDSPLLENLQPNCHKHKDDPPMELSSCS